MNWFWVRKAHQRVRKTTRQISRDRNSSLFSRLRLYRIVRQNLKLLKEASCAKAFCCKLCVAPNSRMKTATSFPSILCGLDTFTDELVWKLVNILNTSSDRILLYFEFISSWVTNFSVGFCCVMFMWTVAVLGVFSAWVGLQLNTTHQYKIWNVCFVANFLCYNIAKYL